MNEQQRIQKSLFRSMLFEGVSAVEVEKIAATACLYHVEQGQYVYRQEDRDRRFYIIDTGEVELTITTPGERHTILGHIGPGGHFGETSLLTKTGYVFNARALSDLTLLCFDADAFNAVLLTNSVIQHQLSIALARRLRVSFHDHANTLDKLKQSRQDGGTMGPNFFADPEQNLTTGPRPLVLDEEGRLAESALAKQIRTIVRRFGENMKPVLLTGESGTGRRLVAHEIHRTGTYQKGPYIVVDIRDIDALQLPVELFGHERAPFSFSAISELGVFEQYQGGTVVLHHAEYMEPEIQHQLAQMLESGFFTRADGKEKVALRSRVILICTDAPRMNNGHEHLLPELFNLFANQHFQVAPLREHRRDIPRLVRYYLQNFSLQYGKVIDRVDDQTLGMLMNYDWPGNMTEMSSVLQRAVMLGKDNEPLNDQILLGLPKSEGKWEFNLLRLSVIKNILNSRLFPVLPKILLSLFFLIVLIALLFGPSDAVHNIGITFSWAIGWPLLFFSFFFLARIWCSVCPLSVPGWAMQILLKPQRGTPAFIRKNSGWIMTGLCILFFWVEITWNANESPGLTAWIILSVSLGSLLFSIFFQRRVWCRYLCPLGAINAIFAMPAVLELRSNNHMCMNRCRNHHCFTGNEQVGGCPMLRHPFLVDNNRDCVLCGQCIKTCQQNSIHLNLRLAPQELWNLQSPRLEDSVLVVSLGAIFFPFAMGQQTSDMLVQWFPPLQQIAGSWSSGMVTGLFFFAIVFFYLGSYAVLSRIMALLTHTPWQKVAAILGYGMIPLVLGAFLALHLDLFVNDLWRLLPNLQELFGGEATYTPTRLMSRDAAFVLQFITVMGGLIAALYANTRIVRRLRQNRGGSRHAVLLPGLLLCLSAIAYLNFL